MTSFEVTSRSSLSKSHSIAHMLFWATATHYPAVLISSTKLFQHNFSNIFADKNYTKAKLKIVHDD